MNIPVYENHQKSREMFQRADVLLRLIYLTFLTIHLQDRQARLITIRRMYMTSSLRRL